jgi:excisionase family DNA binding protein
MVASKFRDVQNVADELGVDVQTVRRWIHAGRLPAVRPGKEYRIREADLEEFLAAREVRPKGRASSPLEPSLLNGLEEERRIDFAAVAGAIDAFTAHWTRAVGEGRTLDQAQLADFVAAVRYIAVTLRELRGAADARDRSVMQPTLRRFVVVAVAVGELAEDREAAAAELNDALEPIAA